MKYNKFVLFIAAILLGNLITLGIYDFVHPSESRYATIAMRMALTDNFLMPFFSPEIPFFGKPPLSFWASAISFKIFGFNTFSGRLPHFLMLVAVVFMLFRFVKKFYDEKTAFAAAIILTSSVLFYTLHSVMTEASLLLGMTIISLSFFEQLQSKQKNFTGYLFFIGCAIALLAKGPVGIAIPAISIFTYLLFSKRFKEFFTKFPIILGGILFLVLSLPWFIMAQIKYPEFLEYFIIGENLSRFSNPNWKGDLYGTPHNVRFGMIWVFFIISTIPTIFLVFFKPHKIYKTIKDTIAKDQILLFFTISTLLPLLFLTFMRSMILTYAIYSLLSFAIVMARIIMLNKWEKFIISITYFTIAIYLAVIAILLTNNDKIIEKLDYQTYLIKHIDQHQLTPGKPIYYLGITHNNFAGYWFSKDNVEFIDQNNFGNFLKKAKEQNENLFFIGHVVAYEGLQDKYRQQLKTIICSPKNKACLYETILQ